MDNTAEYTENETGELVRAQSLASWEDGNVRSVVVTYPNKRQYLVPLAVFNTHFTIVSPQTISISGAVGYDRPTPEQRKLEGL